MHLVYKFRYQPQNIQFKMESETTSGKRCLIFENNKFSFKYQGKLFATWRCTIRRCPASIRTDKNGVIQNDVEVFCDYVLDTYINPEGQQGYHPSMWARMPDDGQVPTTTNGTEAFHRHLNACFKTAHPNIFCLATELLALQEETCVKLRSNNTERRLRSVQVKRNEEIRDICGRYRLGQLSRLEYIRLIAFKFLPVHV
jgi:hypothetical protein